MAKENATPKQLAFVSRVKSFKRRHKVYNGFIANLVNLSEKYVKNTLANVGDINDTFINKVSSAMEKYDKEAK